MIAKNRSSSRIISIITHWEKLLDSDWLRHYEFIRNLRANFVIRGKLQISWAKSVIHSECKYKKELTVNDLLPGLLGPYYEIRSPMFFVRPELAKAVHKSECFIFLVRTE